MTTFKGSGCEKLALGISGLHNGSEYYFPPESDSVVSTVVKILQAQARRFVTSCKSMAPCIQHDRSQNSCNKVERQQAKLRFTHKCIQDCIILKIARVEE